jgi:hypothetical protein
MLSIYVSQPLKELSPNNVGTLPPLYLPTPKSPGILFNIFENMYSLLARLATNLHTQCFMPVDIDSGNLAMNISQQSQYQTIPNFRKFFKTTA